MRALHLQKVPFSKSYFYLNKDQKLNDFQYNTTQGLFKKNKINLRMQILAHVSLTPYGYKIFFNSSYIWI